MLNNTLNTDYFDMEMAVAAVVAVEVSFYSMYERAPAKERRDIKHDFLFRKSMGNSVM